MAEHQAQSGCPSIDLVELPRLKLAFMVRPDHNGELRLYSLDHSDLFVTNDRHPLINKMVQGIPHCLLLSNLKGEMQVTHAQTHGHARTHKHKHARTCTHAGPRASVVSAPT